MGVNQTVVSLEFGLPLPVKRIRKFCACAEKGRGSRAGIEALGLAEGSSCSRKQGGEGGREGEEEGEGGGESQKMRSCGRYPRVSGTVAIRAGSGLFVSGQGVVVGRGGMLAAGHLDVKFFPLSPWERKD